MTKPNKSQYRRGDSVTGAVCAWPDGLRHDIEPYPFYSRERTFCEEHSTQQRRVKQDPETGERSLVTEEYSLGTYTETKYVTFRLLASWARWWQFQNKVTNLSRRAKPEPSPEALMLGVSGDGDPFEWELDPHPQYRAEGVMRIVTKRGRKTYRKTLVDFLMGRTTVTQRVKTKGGIDSTGASDEPRLLDEEHGPDSTVGLWQSGAALPPAQRGDVPQVQNFGETRRVRTEGAFDPKVPTLGQFPGDVRGDQSPGARRPGKFMARLGLALARDLAGHADSEDRVAMAVAQERNPLAYEQVRLRMSAARALKVAEADARAGLIVGTEG